jgi:hypothetical protein
VRSRFRRSTENRLGRRQIQIGELDRFSAIKINVDDVARITSDPQREVATVIEMRLRLCSL